MSEIVSNYRVAIYLKGDHLDPDQLTQVIGLPPTDCHRRGDSWRTPSGSEVKESTGLWSLLIKDDGVDISSAIIRLASGAKVSSWSGLPGVEEAYLDVFIAMDADAAGGGECEFFLSTDAAKKVKELNLITKFAVAIVMPCTIAPD